MCAVSNVSSVLVYSSSVKCTLVLTIFPCVIPSTVDNTKCEAELHSFSHPPPITIYNPHYSRFPCVDEVLKDKITQTKPKMQTKTLSVLLLFFFLLSDFSLSLPVKLHVKSVRSNPVFITERAPCWFLEEIQISHHFSSSLPDRELIRWWRQWREQLPPRKNTISESHAGLLSGFGGWRERRRGKGDDVCAACVGSRRDLCVCDWMPLFVLIWFNQQCVGHVSGLCA